MPPGVGFPHDVHVMGVIGGCAQWLALSDGVLSVTISAADHMMDREAAEIADTLWREVQALVCPRS